MAEQLKDGGPAGAFYELAQDSEPGSPRVIAQHFGLSIRDYFAAAALQGLLAKLPIVDQKGEWGDPVPDKIAHNREIAESCYWMADAMLAARSAKLTAEVIDKGE